MTFEEFKTKVVKDYEDDKIEFDDMVKKVWESAVEQCIEEARRVQSSMSNSVKDWMNGGDNEMALRRLIEAGAVGLVVCALLRLKENT